jgi:hypothetical protein
MYELVHNRCSLASPAQELVVRASLGFEGDRFFGNNQRLVLEKH